MTFDLANFDLISLVPYALFGAITIVAWVMLGQMTTQTTRASERLDELRNPLLREKGRADKQSGVGGLLEKAAPALSKALESKSELERNALKVKLANAGYLNPGAPQLYLSIKFMSLIAGALLGGGFGLLKYGATQNGYMAIGLGAGLGMYLPGIVLSLMVSSRKQKIFLSLPDALDLLVVCVEAGLGLDAGLRRISEELKNSAPELCSELALCNLQTQMGRPRRDVLHDLGVRTGVDDVKSLVAVLIQAEKFGSSIAQALRVQSDAMRVKRRQIAEEKAQKTAVQMLFPMVLFIFPGIFVVLVGPAAIRMYEQMLSK